MAETHKGLIAIYLTVLLLATNGLFAKGLPLGSIDITVVRGVIAAITIAIFAPFLKLRLAGLQRRDFVTLVGLGLLLSVHWASFFEAMRVSSIAVGMTMLYTYPVFTVFFEAATERKRIELPDLFLAGLMMVGVFIISSPGQDDSGLLLGVGWGLFSAIIFALRNVLQRKLCRHIQPVAAVGCQSLAGSLLLLPFLNVGALRQDMSTMMYLLLLGVVFTAVPHSLLATALKHLSAKTVSFIGCLQPILGALIALAVLRETPGLNVIIGGTIIVSVAMLETMKSVLRHRKLAQERA